MALLYWLPLNGNLNQCGLSGYKATSNNVTFGANGKFTKSAATTGNANSYIETNFPISEIGNKDFSISVWVKIPTQTSGTWKCVIGTKGTGAASMGANLYWQYVQKKLMWSTGDGSTAQEFFTTDTLDSIVYDKWVNIIMIRDHNDSKVGYFIVNKQRYDLTTIPTILTFSGTRTFRIGSNYDNTYPLNEYIADIRIYDHVLTSSEIDKIYAAEFCHYHFNDPMVIQDKHKYQLPSEYQEVEYLESSGTQWINTGYIHKAYPLTLTALMSWNGDSGFHTSGEHDFWGNYSNGLNTTDIFVCGKQSGAHAWYQWGGASWIPHSDVNLVFCDKHYTSFTYEGASGRKAVIDGVEYHSTLSNYNNTTGTTNPIGLFSGAGDRNYLAASVRIYTASIKENHKLVVKLVPCYRKSDGKPGMYDLISQTFKTNVGTGEFYIGPLVKELPNEYYSIRSCDSDGTQRLDTGMHATYGDRWTFEFENRANNGTVMKPSNENKGYSTGNPNTLGIAGGGRVQADSFTSFSVWRYGSNYQFSPNIKLSDTKNQIFEEILIIKEKTSNYLYNKSLNQYHSMIDANTPNTTNFDSSANMCLFQDIAYPFPGAKHFYRCTCQHNNIMVRDLIPAVRKLDKKVGMYDLVNDVFYSSVISNKELTQGETDRGILYDGTGWNWQGIKNNKIILENNSPRYNTGTVFNPQYIYAPNLKPNGMTNMTLSAWVYLNNYHASDRSVIAVNGTYMTITSDGKLSSYAYGKSHAGYDDSITVIPLNTWTHIAEVWDDTSVKLYINGVLDTTVNTSGAMSGGSVASPMCIGSENGTTTRQLNGNLTDWRYFATALTADEVMNLYKMGHAA